MNQKIYIYDPTAADTLSRVRGIGRFMQILHENLGNECIFTADLSQVPADATFINPFLNFLQPPLITNRIAKRQIAVIHDLIPLKYSTHFPIGFRGKINVFRNKRSLKNYDVIITNSETTKQDVINMLGVSEQKIQVIYPIPARLFTDNQHKTPSDPIRHIIDNNKYCLYVGDATWNKNLVNLAQAIKKTNIPCIFVGKVFTTHLPKPPSNIWLQELFEFQQLTANDPQFIFPGFVSDDDLIALYRNALCNLLVSQDEGFGFSFVEAAALKVPSILSDIPALKETARGAAIFVDQNNTDIIAAAITKISTDRLKHQNLAEASYERSIYFNSANFKSSFLSLNR